MRNLVYVEGLNPRYRSSEGTGPLISDEKYLEINKEVCFVPLSSLLLGCFNRMYFSQTVDYCPE